MERHLTAERVITAPFATARALVRVDPTVAIAERLLERTTTLHVEVAGFDVARRVELDVGEAVDVDDTCVSVPVRWTPIGTDLLPLLEGSVEFVALSDRPALTRVAFVGHYRPPLRALGAAWDGVAGHTLAQRTVDRLVDDVADRLLTVVAAG